MLGIYMQRSWLILLAFAVLLYPMYVFSGPLLAALGQPADLSREAGSVSVYFLPSHFMYAVHLPVLTFLQCQNKNWVTAATAAAMLAVHVAATWVLVKCLGLGIFGVAMAFNLSWVVFAALLVACALGGGCLETWSGFSTSAFVNLEEFLVRNRPNYLD
jgi:MATE family multidrug resistance protein